MYNQLITWAKLLHNIFQCIQDRFLLCIIWNSLNEWQLLEKCYFNLKWNTESLSWVTFWNCTLAVRPKTTWRFLFESQETHFFLLVDLISNMWSRRVGHWLRNDWMQIDNIIFPVKATQCSFGHQATSSGKSQCRNKLFFYFSSYFLLS